MTGRDGWAAWEYSTRCCGDQRLGFWQRCKFGWHYGCHAYNRNTSHCLGQSSEWGQQNGTSLQCNTVHSLKPSLFLPAKLQWLCLFPMPPLKLFRTTLLLLSVTAWQEGFWDAVLSPDPILWFVDHVDVVLHNTWNLSVLVTELTCWGFTLCTGKCFCRSQSLPDKWF